MGASRYEDLEVWRTARELFGDVWEVSSDGRFGRDFTMRDQIRRAALSTMNNVAEGFGRKSDRQFRYFLEVAAGSCLEVQSILYAALDRGYLAKDTFEHLYGLCATLYKKLMALIGYLSRSLAS